MESIMKRLASRIFVALILAVLCAGFVQAQTTDNNKPLTNEAVLKLVKAGFKEKTVISIIDARPPSYDLSPDRMIELKRNRVSENIIIAMLNRQQGLTGDDEAWGNDPFFKKGDKPKDNSSSGTGQNQQDIFGSSGSGQSSTRSRGGNSDASGDTMTTGTATVRIIRPPTDSPGAPLKLEKTPSLTNDSIIELVEAGFSEGTIVRRI